MGCRPHGPIEFVRVAKISKVYGVIKMLVQGTGKIRPWVDDVGTDGPAQGLEAGSVGVTRVAGLRAGASRAPELAFPLRTRMWYCEMRRE